jgi:hypothetical protein
MKGDIRLKNSIAIIFRKKSPSDDFFYASVYLRDNSNKIFTFDFSNNFKTDKVHSLSLTYLRIFGIYSQIILASDDGNVYEGSPLSKGFILENSEQSSVFFPKDINIWKILEEELNESQWRLRVPGAGSMLFRYSHLNSGNGVLQNAIFGEKIDFLKNCLGTCPLNYSLNPLHTSDSNGTNDIQTSSYTSSYCLTCNSVFPYFNWSFLEQSLKNVSSFPKKKDFSFPLTSKFWFEIINI